MRASLLPVVSFFLAVPKFSRWFALLISLCMGTYDVFAHSVMGIINEIIMVLSAIIGILWIDNKIPKTPATKNK